LIEMKKSLGNVTVTTEVGFCPFCSRTRTLRREERHLGGLVRTNIDCETCHRTLSSTMAPAETAPEAADESPAAESPTAEAAVSVAEPESKPAPKPARKPAAAQAKAPAAKKAAGPAATSKAGAKKKA
jgi:hypothetical protein